MKKLMKIIIGERAKRARHSHVCSIENRGYIYLFYTSLASERSERDTLRSVQLRIVYVYVIARAGVIFGIYFTSCRYSGG